MEKKRGLARKGKDLFLKVPFPSGFCLFFFLLVYAIEARLRIATLGKTTEFVHTTLGLSYKRAREFELNRPFPSCCKPHYESEAKCKIFHMKISFVCI